MAKKFDVYFSIRSPFRILSNVSLDELNAYCVERGYKVVHEEQRGVFYWDAYIARAAK